MCRGVCFGRLMPLSKPNRVAASSRLKIGFNAAQPEVIEFSIQHWDHVRRVAVVEVRRQVVVRLCFYGRPRSWPKQGSVLGPAKKTSSAPILATVERGTRVVFKGFFAPRLMQPLHRNFVRPSDVGAHHDLTAQHSQLADMGQKLPLSLSLSLPVGFRCVRVCVGARS